MTERQRKKCAELITECKPQLEKICIAKMHGYTDEIDDVMAELQLALCKQVSGRGFPQSPKAWLYSTLNNIINKSFQKKYRNEKIISNFSVEEIELPDQNDFVDVVIKNIEIEELNKIISQLDKSEQMILKFTYVDKHKMKEIAKLLGITETAAKQKHYRLRLKLRDMLNKKIK